MRNDVGTITNVETETVTGEVVESSQFANTESIFTTEAPVSVRIKSGALDQTFQIPRGQTVSELRASLKDVANLPASGGVRINGKTVEENTIVGSESEEHVVEFRVPAQTNG